MNSNQQPGANDDSSIYTNHPLGPRTTRVVHIISPEEYNATDTISLRLSVISMDPPSAYRAVSYVWGIPDVTETILVDGNPFCIRINLWHFLAQMCKEGYRGALWIDAICINQNDLEERSRQVAIMGEIYSQAQDVRAWLGVGTAQDWLGMKRLVEMDWESALTVPKSVLLNDKEDQECVISEPSILTANKKHHYSNRLLSITTNEFLAPVLGLFELPYWSRLWIVQEFILAQNLTIQCGGHFAIADALKNFVGWIFLATSILETMMNPTGNKSSQNWLESRDLVRSFVDSVLDQRNTANWLVSIKSQVVLSSFMNSVYSQIAVVEWLSSSKTRDIWFVNLDHTTDFAHLIQGTSTFECADFHDYIYAVRSFNVAVFRKITPDYTKSKLQLFLDVTAVLSLGCDELHSREYRRSIHEAAVSLQHRLQLGLGCEEVRRALATVPSPDE